MPFGMKILNFWQEMLLLNINRNIRLSWIRTRIFIFLNINILKVVLTKLTQSP